MIDQLDKTIEFYVKRIISGKTTLDKVPPVIRQRVWDILNENYPELFSD